MVDEKFNDLIALLLAIANYAKDIHYNCGGSAAYSKHLFADLLEDDLYTYIDEIKENVFLANGQEPLSSRVYLTASSLLIPPIDVPSDFLKFVKIKNLIDKCGELLESFGGLSRGANALLDEIAGHMDKCKGLLHLQLKVIPDEEPRAIRVEESVKVDHCDCAVEKIIDRAKAIIAKIDQDKVAKTVKDNEAKNLLVAEDEEDKVLDKLSEKLGV
jgi:DNA-binding ferritin-like protein